MPGFPNIRNNRTQQINILLAEDESLYQEIIKRHMQSLGVRLTIVENGNQCIRKATEQKYDVILMDIVMPGKDGYQATREIREKGITTPIIAVTSNTWPEDEKQSILSGMNDFLAKPFHVTRLAGKINYWIQKQSQTV